MRAFVAIPVPQSVKQLAFNLSEQLKTVGADIKWVEYENYHLTLKFLGETKKDVILNIENHLNMVSEACPCFYLSTSVMGVFPNYRNPRILWLGVKGELNKANYLAERIDLYLNEEGFEIERTRRFHLTLGRIRSDIKQRELLEKVFLINKKIKSIPFVVNKFDLMESKLSSQGPNYKVYKSFWLQR